MTSRIIYHDFRNTPDTAVNITRTAPLLSKGRRSMQTVANINGALNAACVFLCGACVGVSLWIIVALTMWG